MLLEMPMVAMDWIRRYRLPHMGCLTTFCLVCQMLDPVVLVFRMGELLMETGISWIHVFYCCFCFKQFQFVWPTGVAFNHFVRSSRNIA
jgi:hypothetical protein